MFLLLRGAYGRVAEISTAMAEIVADIGRYIVHTVKALQINQQSPTAKYFL